MAAEKPPLAPREQLAPRASLCKIAGESSGS